MHSRLETLRQVSTGELTVDDAAARHAVTRETVIEWSEFFLAGTQARRRVSRPLLATLVCFSALGLAGVARAACNAPVFGTLVGVCPEEPALAADYNLNLQKINARLDAGVVATAAGDAQLRTDLNTTINFTNMKVGTLGTTGVVLQAPTTFGGNVCGPNEVVVTNSSGAVDCRPLYGLSNSPVITAWESGDVAASGNQTSTANLGTTSNKICVLSDVRFRDIEGSHEEARCLVERVGGDWVLYAVTNDDAQAVCRARCIQFNF